MGSPKKKEDKAAEAKQDAKKRRAEQVDEEAPLEALSGSSSKSAKKKTLAKSNTPDNDEETLSSLGKSEAKKEVEGPRPRFLPQVTVRSCLIGYQGDEAFDPDQ